MRPYGSISNSGLGRCGSDQHGAALLTVLLVVALAATVVSGLIWRAEIEARRVSEQQQLYQVRRVLDSAQSWAASLLRWQARHSPGVTALGGLWALPLPPTRLDKLPGLSLPEGTGPSSWHAIILSGRIEDAQSRFNLENLIRNQSGGRMDIEPSQLAVLHRLLQQRHLDPGLARPIAACVLQLAERIAAPGQPPLHNLDQLLQVPGLSPAMLDRLRSALVALPEPTPVNANTASADVLQAVLPALPAQAIADFTARRDHVYLRQLADLQEVVQAALPATASLDLSDLDVDSRYFILHLQAGSGQVRVHRQTLIYRDPRSHQTRILPP